MSPGAGVSRRQFLALGWLPGWFPWFRPNHISLAGARFRILRNGRSRRRYVRIHGNEEAARQVLERHMLTHAGLAYVIDSQVRLTNVESLKLDPNRMFSRVGAEANLKALNPGVAEDRLRGALDLLDRGREKLVRALTPPQGGALIAVHNNGPGYSVADEAPISDRTSLREPGNPHAFFLCTDPADFETLKTSPYNTVLQHRAPPRDDGSLSRLAAARGFRYVNLEVGVGHPERQNEMLNWLDWFLP